MLHHFVAFAAALRGKEYGYCKEYPHIPNHRLVVTFFVTTNFSHELRYHNSFFVKIENDA